MPLRQTTRPPSTILNNHLSASTTRRSLCAFRGPSSKRFDGWHPFLMPVARHGKLPPRRHEELPPPWIAEERANERGTNHGRLIVE
jgi:hypothetical protein